VIKCCGKASCSKMAQKKTPPNKNRSIFNKTAGLPERSPGVVKNEADQTFEEIGTHSLKENQSSRTVKEQISAGDDSSVATDSADELTSASTGGTASTVSQSSKLNAAGAKSGVSSAVHSSGHSLPMQAAVVAVSSSLSEIKSKKSTESQEKPLGTNLRSFTSATSVNAVAGSSSTAASTAGSSVSSEKVSILQQPPSSVETMASKAKADTATNYFFYSMEPVAESTKSSKETQTTFVNITTTSTTLKKALANADKTSTTPGPSTKTVTSTTAEPDSTSTSTTSTSTSTTTTTTTTTPTIRTKGYTTVTTKIPRVKILDKKKE
jgi:hypothetical protein